MQRTKARRSPGVMLRGRAACIHRWDDETREDYGTKAVAHRVVRRIEARDTAALAADELADLGFTGSRTLARF